MVGRRRRVNRKRGLRFATRRHRRFPLRVLVVIAVVIVLFGAAVVIRAAASPVPDLSARRVLAGSLRFPGPAPVPAWPKGGESALEVEGLGSLGTSGPDKPVPIASVAKMMTAYVILQDHPVAPNQNGFNVTIGAADVADYQQRVAEGELVTPVAAGEVLNEIQLLEALLVASGNNIAPILADYDAGSMPAFLTKMNGAARRLGMARTTYADASGISTGTVSTAADQLRLAAAAMADPVFARIVAMSSVNLPVAGTMANFNRAVGTGGYVGVKTGSDTEAGGCLVFANQGSVGGRSFTILGVVLGQDPGQASTSVLATAAQGAADALVQSIKPAVRSVPVLPGGTPVAYVGNRQGRRSVVVTGHPIEALGWGGLTLPVSVTFSRLGRSSPAGATVAEVSVTSAAPARTAATTADAVPQVTFAWRVRNLF